MRKLKLIFSAMVLCLAATISTASFAGCPWVDKSFTPKQCGTDGSKKARICAEKNNLKSKLTDYKNMAGRAKCESKTTIDGIKAEASS